MVGLIAQGFCQAFTLPLHSIWQQALPLPISGCATKMLQCL
jgi:hypothetical protein